MKRLSTGINGLDDLIEGGLPEHSATLISGTAGAGKTIFGLQYICQGAIKNNERGVLITFEQTDHKLQEQAMQFGWDIEKLISEDKIKLISITKYSIGETFSQLQTLLKDYKPKRLVIDSITYIDLYAHALNRLVDLESTPQEEMIHGTKASQTPMEWDQLIIRKIIVDLIKMLQNDDVTTIITSELSEDSQWYSRDTISEFVCDAVILLKSVTLGKDLQRTLEVKKMRGTKIKGGMRNFEFTKKGIEVKAD